MTNYCIYCGFEVSMGTTEVYCTNTQCPSNIPKRFLPPAVYTCAQCGYEGPLPVHSCIRVLKDRIAKLDSDVRRIACRMLADHLIGDMR